MTAPIQSVTDITLGQLAELVSEVKRLREQVAQLQGANNREVERRRMIEAAAAELLAVFKHWPTYAESDLETAKALLRALITSCSTCGACAGEPCRTLGVGAALPVPHPERSGPHGLVYGTCRTKVMLGTAELCCGKALGHAGECSAE